MLCFYLMRREHENKIEIYFNCWCIVHDDAKRDTCCL